MLILSLGLFADAAFGVIAIVNSYIGIRQELNAKKTLDELAVLVAPHAKVVRDGEVISLLAEEIVPGDVIAVEPGDQLVADGEAIASRGMTLDESMLTGEADGIRKDVGERALSGSFCISGSGHYVVDAVREQSYAGRLAGEARAFRHPPSPLQSEVNRVIVACTWVMVPLAALLLLTFQLRSVDLVEAAQTATAGLVTLIPEGMVLLMSVTFAVAAVRLARKDTLVQQMSATESLAAVDTICVDKTGTLTDGKLRLLGVEVAEGADADEACAALGRFAASAGERNRTLETVAEAHPATPGRVGGEVPFSSKWKWSGLRLGGVSYVLGAPDVLADERRAGAGARPRPQARPGNRGGSAGRRLRLLARGAARRPGPHAAAAADATRPGRARGDAARRRRRDDRDDARRRSRPEADLRRRPGDGDRGRLRGRRARRGGRDRGRRAARGPRGARRRSPGQHDLLPDRAGAEEGAGRGAARRRVATRR